MAKLTTAERKEMPKSEFALPGGRYPVNDRGHAIAAKGRATQQLKRGNLTIAEAQKIRSKANRMLGHTHAAGRTKADCPGCMAAEE